MAHEKYGEKAESVPLYTPLTTDCGACSVRDGVIQDLRDTNIALEKALARMSEKWIQEERRADYLRQELDKITSHHDEAENRASEATARVQHLQEQAEKALRLLRSSGSRSDAVSRATKILASA